MIAFSSEPSTGDGGGGGVPSAPITAKDRKAKKEKGDKKIRELRQELADLQAKVDAERARYCAATPAARLS